MGSIREALLRNGVFYFNNNGMTYRIEDGAGNYMVARDANGVVRYRIEASTLSNRLNVVDASTNMVFQTLEMTIL